MADPVKTESLGKSARDANVKPVLSAFVTSRNDGRWLERLILDLVAQEDGTPPFEVIIIEAGDFEPTPQLAKTMGGRFVYHFWKIPGISRCKALNLAIQRAASPFVVRLDARTHVEPDYLNRLYQLWRKTGAANVGGVRVPMGISTDQEIIAEVMKQPFCFGGAADRRKSYHGFADSVYLGAFDRQAVLEVGGYDEERPLISEDSDLNYRLRRSGRGVYVDSSIKAYYLARETPPEFVTLCRNYGVSRVLFMRKHRQITGVRQLAVPAFFVSFVALAIAAMASGWLPVVVVWGAEISGYGFLLFVSSILVARVVSGRPVRAFFLALRLFVTAHTYWLEGMIKGMRMYR